MLVLWLKNPVFAWSSPLGGTAPIPAPAMQQEGGGGAVPASLIGQIWVPWPRPPARSLRRRMSMVGVRSSDQQCLTQNVL